MDLQARQQGVTRLEMLPSRRVGLWSRSDTKSPLEKSPRMLTEAGKSLLARAKHSATQGVVRGAVSAPVAGAAAPLGKNTNRVSPPETKNEDGFSGLRARMMGLRDDLRPWAPKRCGKCGRVRVANDIEIATREGRAHFHGLMRCGSVWECPYCALVIRAERAEEVKSVVAWHGPERSYLVTFTVRHGMGDDLGAIRRGVTLAMRKLQSGAPWQRFQRLYGMAGSVRALETTDGTNGFHPHLHAVFFLRRLSPSELVAVAAWLSTRWRAIVGRVASLGPAHMPTLERGCDIRDCRRADYIAKLGLELTAPATKSATGTSRSLLQIALDFVTTGDEADLTRWQMACRALRGARMLTWSRGIRDAAGLGAEKTDDEIVAGEDATEAVVVAISGAEWDQVRDLPRVKPALLLAAERGGAPAVAAVLALCFALPRDRYGRPTAAGVKEFPAFLAARIPPRPIVPAVPSWVAVHSLIEANTNHGNVT